MIRTRGLGHINLNVSDLERSKRFYCELFGLEVLMEYEGPMGEQPTGRQVALSTPGANDVIALSQVPGVPIGSGGVNHFGFNLVADEDVDAAVAEAVRAGGRLIREHTSKSNGVVEHNAYVADPDGYVVELSAQAVLLARKHRQSGESQS
jgi:catechol 2,3-dioxygenase-like lactoylglutathione lyase family enzyme